jgi:hypothetical protein
MTGRELAHELKDVSAASQPVEQHPPGGSRALRRGQLPAGHRHCYAVHGISATLVVLSWTWPTVKKYRQRMDQATRNDIAAAAEAHRELGNVYDDAVAESLIDRIGAEIDKRVEAKLGARPQSARSLGEAVPPGGHQALLLGTGIGAGITGLVAIIAEHGSKGMVAPMLVIWVIVAVAALGTAAVNRYRSIRRG